MSHIKNKLSLPGLIAWLALMLVAGNASATSLNLANTPLFLTQPAEPRVMLNVSNDQQLYFKAYNDFSDLDKDGVPETTYKNSISYYGYFDPSKCYNYVNSRYEPVSITADHYCAGTWSGNFLNWATMTRIDTVRKILYGGLRSTDTATETVLERSFLPNDAHSFAKFYNGPDLDKLTPFSSTSGITLCNTTVAGSSAVSQTVTNPPLIRIAKGNFSLWAANERWQCRWSEEVVRGNANDPAKSGINAGSTNPSISANGIGTPYDYIARVQACVKNLIGTEQCEFYPSGDPKPIGLLQTYGEKDTLLFGLMTGSYNKNKSGGVLRKNVGGMSDEINVTTDGTFKSAPANGGIINTLNLLRLYGYGYDRGYYNVHDNCKWGLSSFNNGSCTNWGNPQTEIFLESLRYLAGKSPTSAFNANDSGKIAGLFTATWVDPIPSDKWCAPLSIIQFNASTSSYDGDEVSGSSDIGATNLSAWTDAVGAGENIPGNQYFVGENGSNNNQLCTAKTVTSLSSVRGTCPDAPRLSGSYGIAGLAYYAHTNSIRTDLIENRQTVTTYGVALAPAVPEIKIPVPNSSNTVTILPACRNDNIGGNCSLVDFKIVSQNINAGTGKFYVNWEDSEQGGDFDQDMWGILNYSINTGTNTITVTTDVIAQSTGFRMGFGYIINGTVMDGFHAHSGINNFNYTDPSGVLGCTSCTTGNTATQVTYPLGSSSAKLLEQPLYYAAKWGGFDDQNNDASGQNGANTPDQTVEWDSDSDGIPDRYFFATNPGQLATQLNSALSNVVQTSSSASAVATNSTRLDTNTLIYQARFDSKDWSGQLLAFAINSIDGSIISSPPAWSTDTVGKIPAFGSRNIFSYNPSASPKGIDFTWANLDPTLQQPTLKFSGETNNTNAQQRVDYLRGDTSQELQNGGSFRDRIKLLGDIIDSNPWFVGADDFGYSTLPEGSSYQAYLASISGRTKMLYVGANDGMLHAFSAANGTELFAYVPASIIPQLKNLTLISYGNGTPHQYFVDGSPRAGDVYYNNAWHTVLVGTMGAGARSVYALDVTDPDNFSASNVLWEFTDPDLGYTLSEATIARMANGKWAAIFGNGYNSDNGHAVLFIRDIKDGSLIKTIDTQAGSTSTPNGLATPIPVDTNGDHIVDTIYAGDLLGNMWKFDVSGTNTGSWKPAFGTNPSPQPLFVARDAAGVRQPITAKPQVGLHPDSGVMVYFGTGKYFETSDNIVGSTPQIQTYYGIHDNGSQISGRSSLVQQTIDAQTSVSGFDIRVTSNNNVDFTVKDGWFMDLIPPSSTVGEGERVISPSLLRGDRLVFTTIIPNSDACTFGGTSWLMELDAVSGGRLSTSPFDINNDGVFDLADQALTDTNGDGVINNQDKKQVVSGKKSKIGIIKTPSVITAGTKEYKYASGSTGALESTGESSGLKNGRQSWRQLR